MTINVMTEENHPSVSVFRSNAWIQAWIDTWGKDPWVELIDLGGRKNPLETLYRTTSRIKGILPISTLCLPGTGFGNLSSPRAEYNTLPHLDDLGGLSALGNLIKGIRWNQVSLIGKVGLGRRSKQLLRVIIGPSI